MINIKYTFLFLSIQTLNNSWFIFKNLDKKTT